MSRSPAPGATCKAAYHDNGKIKPDIVFVNVKQALLETHPERRYYMSHNGQWTDAGTAAIEAQRKRKRRLALDDYNRLNGKASGQKRDRFSSTAALRMSTSAGTTSRC